MVSALFEGTRNLIWNLTGWYLQVLLIQCWRIMLLLLFSSSKKSDGNESLDQFDCISHIMYVLVLTPSWKFCYIEDSRGKRTICLYAAIAKARFVGQGFMAQKELAIEIRSPISRSKTKNSYLEEVGTTLISLETEFVKVRSYYSV